MTASVLACCPTAIVARGGAERAEKEEKAPRGSVVAPGLLRVLRALRASACASLLALAGCGGGITVADTYCRDTFFWRTSARDTEESRRQADLHNSRRLCRCQGDCP